MENSLRQELELLRKEIGTPDADERLERIKNVYASEEDKRLINEYVKLMLNDIGVRLGSVEKEVQRLRSSSQTASKKTGSLPV